MHDGIGYDAIFVIYAFFNCSTCIGIEVYMLAAYDVVICIDRNTYVVLAVSDVGCDKVVYRSSLAYVGLCSVECPCEQSVVESDTERPLRGEVYLYSGSY